MCIFIGTTWQSFSTGHLVPGYHTFTLVAMDTVSGAEHINIQPFFVNTSEQCIHVHTLNVPLYSVCEGNGYSIVE